MSLLITLLALLALCLVWIFMWKKTLLDTARDALFDLRDGSREWFLKNGHSLDEPVYRNLRKMLNLHLRQMDELSLTRYLVTLHFLEKNPGDKEKILQTLEDEFYTEQEGIKEYVNTVRAKASGVILSYMFSSNPLLFVFSVVISIMGIIRLAWGTLRDSRFGQLGIPQSAVFAAALTLLISLPCKTMARWSQAGRFLNQQRVESYSAGTPTERVTPFFSPPASHC